MNTVNVLRRVQQRLTKPECWTKGTSARDATWCEVESWDPTAVCYCLLGAIWLELGVEYGCTWSACTDVTSDAHTNKVSADTHVGRVGVNAHASEVALYELICSAVPAICQGSLKGALAISRWQDMPERTHQEVLEALANAISIAESRASVA